jgi:4-amino-4-deoxy-L-arabinose transferase-like glycosyltransferase/membrane-associated phospholipid phosphatase
MPAWSSSLIEAGRQRRGWVLSALLLAIGCAIVLPNDAGIQSVVRGWNDLPGIPGLLDLFRPFGRGEVAVLVILAVGAAGRRQLAGQLLTALVFSAVLTWMLKVGVGRIRPNGGEFSFVSGDTSCAFALVPLLARRWTTGIGVCVVAAGVALSRVVLNYHWPADVLGGAAIGLLSGAVAAGLWPRRPWSWLSNRRFWLALAAVAWLGAVIWAVGSPKVAWLSTFLLVWGPALLARVAWPWLRFRLRRGWLPPLWAVATGLVAMLFLLSATSSLWDRDEPRNALAAREMIANQAWLVPTFNGEPRLHKPILPYWLMTAALRTGLPADLACRLPAVLCMSLAVLLLGLTARRLLPGRPQAAVIAMLALATSPLVLVSGSGATTDAALMLGIAATMWVLVQALLDGARIWHVLVAGVAIGWALLSKGPMALLVPGATMAVLGTCAWTSAGRGLVTWRTWLVMLGAVLLGGLIALAWFVPANAATDGAVWNVMIGDHLLKRGFEARESHGGPLWYYLPVLVVAFVAWLPALIATVCRPWQSGPEGRIRLIALAWAVPVLLAVSLFQTKLPHYLLPMLWPMALLIALAVVARHDTPWPRWSQRLQVGLLGVVAFGLMVAPVVVVVLQAIGTLVFPLPLVPAAGTALAAGLSFWLLAAMMRRSRQLAGAVALGMLAVGVALAANVWRLEAFKPAQRIAESVHGAIPAGVPVACGSFEEPSLMFYLGPEYGPVRIVKGRRQLHEWMQEPGPGVIILPQQDAIELQTNPALTRIFRTKGYNYSNGKAVDVVVLGRSLQLR